MWLPNSNVLSGAPKRIWLVGLGLLAGASALPAAERGSDTAHDHQVGMDLRQPATEAALKAALPWLEKAAQGYPPNPDYIGDYGGACLELAEKTDSYFLAVKGRELLKQAVKLNPDDVEARAGLMEFYARAPWPLADLTEAEYQAAEIGRRDAKLGAQQEVRLGGWMERKQKKDAALRAYSAALLFYPGNEKAKAGVQRLGRP
jgi:tetratricopeptide (TPR) repeat protein